MNNFEQIVYNSYKGKLRKEFIGRSLTDELREDLLNTSEYYIRCFLANFLYNIEDGFPDTFDPDYTDFIVRYNIDYYLATKNITGNPILTDFVPGDNFSVEVIYETANTN